MWKHLWRMWAILLIKIRVTNLTTIQLSRMERWMMYRDSLAVSPCARCAQYLLLVRSTTQLCMKYSKKWVLNTQPVLVAIEMYINLTRGQSLKKDKPAFKAGFYFDHAGRSLSRLVFSKFGIWNFCLVLSCLFKKVKSLVLSCLVFSEKWNHLSCLVSSFSCVRYICLFSWGDGAIAHTICRIVHKNWY